MQRTNQLAREARAAPSLRQSEATAVKSILFWVHDDDMLEGRFQAALSMARACGAHLRLLHVVPITAYVAVDSFDGAFVSGEILEALQEDAANLRDRLETHLKLEDVTWSYDLITSALIPELIQASAFADILIIGRQPSWREFGRTGSALVGQLLYDLRTPLCIVGDDGKDFDPFGNAIIAWNGSIEAANSVRAAIGLLRMASSVRIVRKVEDKQSAFPDTRLLEYLSRHGISAVLDERVVAKDLAAELVEYSRVFAADYMVMGGYSHSRAGEFLFGGVTRELLRACPTTLVMSR